MDKNLTRLLIIAVLVSYIFCSSAQNPTSAKEGTSTDVYTRNDCNPHTHVCTEPHTDTKSTKEEEGSSGEEHHYKEKICIPGTPLCNDGHPDPKPTKKADTKLTKEAATEEDTSEFKQSDFCGPTTHQCCDGHIKSDTVDPPVESSGKEDASKSEDSIICDPITKLCKGAETNSVISELTKADLPEANYWENPNPESPIVCNPETKKYTGPNPESLDMESGKAAQIEDSIQGERKITNFGACTIVHGKEICGEQHKNPEPTKKADAEPTKEAVMEEDTSEFKPLTVCDPITHQCQVEHIGKSDTIDPPVESSGIEDASKSEDSIICDPITHQCQVEHIGKSDTIDPPVESSGIEDASKSEDSIICDPITKLCNGAQTNSVILEPTKADLPEADSWEFNPKPESPIVCNPETKKYTGPKPKSLDIESDKTAQIEDFIQEEKQGINFNVCKINHDETKSCQDPTPAFGIA